MALKPLLVALRAKGPLELAKRGFAITSRYGLGASRMDGYLHTLTRIIDEYGAQATLPVTVSAAERHPEIVRRYAQQGIEFAVHGYSHIDHIALTEDEQVSALAQGRMALERVGVTGTGFRAPYLRWSPATMSAVARNGFTYDSSQAFHWSITGLQTNEAYQRVLEFCHSRPVEDEPILPWIEDGLVRIPYSLPDDEALVDRLNITKPEQIAEIWLQVWRQVHERGDLFTLGMHPERIPFCGLGVASVLRAARQAEPPVWVARLNDIATWWRARAEAKVTVTRVEPDRFRVELKKPREAMLIIPGLDASKSIEGKGDSISGADKDRMVSASVRPVVGVHSSLDSVWTSFLRDRGYVVEAANKGGDVSVFIGPGSSPKSGPELVSRLENSNSPLLKIARWPNGAKSALAITGDIDALTLWDYGRRLVGE